MGAVCDTKAALAYLRVSGKGQEDKDGFDRQRIAIQRYADASGITIKEWYQDVQSGRDEWQDRPGWSSMMAAMGACRTILVEKLDRVARSVLVQELIIKDLAKREVRLLTAAGDDTSDESPERTMFRQLLALFAEYERASIVLKLRGARQRMKEETGRCEGRKPFGYRPGESVALAQMRQMRDAGAKLGEIADALNKAGHVARYGGTWKKATIAKILARD
jgi:DNA invertase Pin-like site-specific DNA recombinase